MKRNRIFAVGGAMLALIIVLGAPAAAKDQNKSIEKYQATAMAVAGGGRGSTLEINIYGWTAEEERQEALATIQAAWENAARRKKHGYVNVYASSSKK